MNWCVLTPGRDLRWYSSWALGKKIHINISSKHLTIKKKNRKCCIFKLNSHLSDRLYSFHRIKSRIASCWYALLSKMEWDNKNSLSKSCQFDWFQQSHQFRVIRIEWKTCGACEVTSKFHIMSKLTRHDTVSHQSTFIIYGYYLKYRKYRLDSKKIDVSSSSFKWNLWNLLYPH